MRMKKNNNKMFWVLLLLVLVLSVVGIFFWEISLAPVNPSDKSIRQFTVEKGEALKAVAHSLEQKGLIRSWLIFVLQVKKQGLSGQIQAGDFKLSPSLSSGQVLEVLNHGTKDIWVTIPEGWRKEEIDERLVKLLGFTSGDFSQIASEGYMFPDTYLIPKNATASFVVDLMRQNFDKKITAKKFSGLSLLEIVTLASIVERETKHSQDRPLVAGILLKRLQHDWPLEVDATLQYALGYSASEKNWWRKNLTQDDLNLNSPYNTRIYKGLPPGPISNPGLASLQAVFNPQDSPYWFYLSDKNGNMHYAKTIEEHTENIKKFL